MSKPKPPTKKAARARAKPRPRPSTAQAQTPQRHRPAKGGIDQAALLAALEAHILGEREMSSSQVSAALALLKKFLSAGDTAPASHEDALEQLDA